MPLYVVIWGKCEPAQLLGAGQRKVGRFYPFPEAAGRFLECTKKRGLAPGHLEDSRIWMREKSCPFTSTLCIILSNLGRWMPWVGDRRAVELPATRWSQETSECPENNTLALAPAALLLSLETPGNIPSILWIHSAIGFMWTVTEDCLFYVWS